MEWLAAAITGLVGAVGVFFTWLSGKQGRDHAERLAHQTYEHQRQLDRDARIQERLGEAYLRLLEMVGQVGAWAQAVKPLMDTVPPQPVPELPEVSKQIGVEAAVNAFASDAVREALGAWRRVVVDLRQVVLLIDLERDADARGDRRHAQLQSPWRTLHELRPAEAQARARLIERVADELGHRLLESGPPIDIVTTPVGASLPDAPVVPEDRIPEGPGGREADKGHAGGTTTGENEK